MWNDLQKNLFEKIKGNKKLVSEFGKLQEKVSKNIISPTEASKKILHHYTKNNKSQFNYFIYKKNDQTMRINRCKNFFW